MWHLSDGFLELHPLQLQKKAEFCMLNFMAAFNNLYYTANQRYLMGLDQPVKKSAKCTHAGRKKTNMTKSKKSEILCRSLFMSQRLSLTIVTGIQEGSLMQCSTPEKPAFSLYQFPTPKQGFLPWIPYKIKGWCCCGQGGHIVPMFSFLFFSALN